jgi:hypothetical protein
MKSSIGVLIAAVALLCGGMSGVQAQTWQRTKMSQGYYAAYVTNGNGATFRVDCGASADGAKTEVQSLTYLPGRAAAAGTAKGAIKIDGKSFAATFKVAQDGSDPVEIQLGWDDMDSLELLKDIVARIRKGGTLAIELSQLRLRDSFGLSAAPNALGGCQ